jgi:hypothetical protein
MGAFRNLVTEDLPEYRVRKPSPILSEHEVAALEAARDRLMSIKLDRSRRIMGTREIDDALAHIETRLIAHRASLERIAGVKTNG